MNILVIPSWYPMGADKLMGIYHKEFCQSLAKRKDVNVNMLFLDRQLLSKPIKYLRITKREVINEDGYKVYVRRIMDLNRISPKLAIKHYAKMLDKAFREYLKNNPKPDVIHAMVSIPAGYGACLLGKKYNIPVVVTEHASYFLDFFKEPFEEFGKFVLNNAYFTTVSSYMAKSLEEKYEVKCDILPNQVDINSFQKKKKKSDQLNLVIVSAFRKGKHVDHAIMALKKLVDAKKLDKVMLTIIGEGMDNYYVDKCHELGMDKYVDFVGRKNKNEVASIVSQSDILIITSEKETFGIPGIEALAAGVPVISSKCGGPEEYIDEACGKLYEVGDTEALSKAILEVANNLDKYDYGNLRQVASRFSEESVVSKALEIYDKIRK